jgi:hypothetical protein
MREKETLRIDDWSRRHQAPMTNHQSPIRQSLVARSPWLAVAVIAALMMLVALPALAQGGQRSTPVSMQRWHPRLEALKPSEPLAYFELAEEIADASSDASHRDLSRHLFGLAGALDPRRLGRSACLALAATETTEDGRRHLLGMASLLGDPPLLSVGASSGAGGRAEALAAVAAAAGSSAALSLAEAFGHYRRGAGARALEVLRRPGVTELLHACDRLLPGGAAKFVDDCRLLRSSNRPALSPSELDRMLRLEATLLASERTWSSDLLLTDGRTLIDIDPARLHEALGVDVNRPYFRAGRWTDRRDL